MKVASVDRRSFLKLSLTAGGGLIIGMNPLLSMVGKVKADPVKLGDFVEIEASGKILINLCKHEMGQGVSTGLTMLLAEELDADWEQVQVVFSDPIPGISNGTGGSTSTLGSWEKLRQAGAMARGALLKAVARKWNVTVDRLKISQSMISHPPSGRRLSFAEVLPLLRPADLAEKEVRLKQRNEYQLLGKPMPSKIIPSIVKGQQPYSLDLRLKGLKYAVVARCPSFGGRLIRYAVEEALAVPGVEKVVKIEGVTIDGNGHVRDGLAVIATNTWAAMQGGEKLKIEWEASDKAGIVHQAFLKEAYDKLEHEPGAEIWKREPEAYQPVEADLVKSYTYEFPYQHHACMEPLNATARVSEKGCEIWAGTQSADRIIETVAEQLGFNQDKVKVHIMPSGGGFGLRYHACFALEAALVSKAAGGDLVKMVYSREDDIKFDYLNPLELNKHTFHIKDQRIEAWDFKVLIDNWGGACSWIFYDVPKVETRQVNVKGFTQMGAWRSVMGNAEGFSVECAIDELAHDLGRDPYEFRLDMLKEGHMQDVNHQYPCNITRIKNCLVQVAEHARWGHVPKQVGQGRGLSVFPYMHGNGYAAAVADVSFESGKLRVDKVTIAVDCGFVVNPDQVRQQMEGGIIWAISAMYYGGAEYENGVVQRSNFHDNRLLRIHQTPEIEVIICENEEQQPWGVGEIAGPVTYPAVCNAIFDATGQRLRKLPLPDNML